MAESHKVAKFTDSPNRLSTVKSFNRVVGEFVLKETIGGGSYGKVKLAVHTKTFEYYAIKLLPNKPNMTASIKKEIEILKSLKHSNIVKYVRDMQDEKFTYIVMEHSAGGELFDKIEPDFGMDADLVHFYFSQLISTVKYLHIRGVCHRDLKPENILLDEYGNLVLGDFGCASVFRFKGTYRRLTEMCGSAPYAAPEILRPPYVAEPVDIWSCGVILFVLFAGNTPWDEPTTHSREFMDFREGHLDVAPWTSFPKSALDLLIGMLRVDPLERFTVADIEKHPWFKQHNPMLVQANSRSMDVTARLMRIMKSSKPSKSFVHSSSQPVTYNDSMQLDAALHDPLDYFSQPEPTTMSSSPALSFSQSTPLRPLGDLGERLTRFYTEAPPFAVIKRISTALTQLGHANQPHMSASKITVITQDRRKCPLRGTVHVDKLQTVLCLVKFRRTKGDPVEFKRMFIQLTKLLVDIIHEEPQAVPAKRTNPFV